MGGWNSETTLLEKAVLRPIKQQGGGGSWRDPFRILTTLLLSLLLPLSFLLLARLSTARHISAPATSQPSTNCRDDDHLLCFLFLFHHFINTSTIVYALVCLVTVAAFVHGLTAGPPASLNVLSSNRRCQSPVSVEPDDAFRRLRLYAAWIILCTLQICVGLGIEGSTSTDAGCSLMMRHFHGSPTPGWQERISSLLSRVTFIVGLHETTHFWSKSVVKPVVDDTVMGCVVKEERWMERVGMAMSFGGLWWWKLKDEVDALAAVVMKKELQPMLLVVQEQGAGGLGVADLVGWWLYYLTAAIGSIRLIKGGIWLGMILLFKFRRGYLRRRRRQDSASDTPASDHDYQV
ncbi:unnamed protein product [Coffea canephora]|uniref:Uncharacterized protein n=1 Tax=Coffea canephora TaxID=49390 RepID=A0A068V980_COFCA|nr:unnamed protein product [Coffea canephora]